MEDYNTPVVNIPNILFLKGISEEDYISIDDKANERYTQKNMDELHNYTMYNKNNIKFLSNEKWPNKTNLHCWNCDFTFDNDSIFIPIYIKECITGGLEFGIKGNMCSFNCAMSYILDKTTQGTAERWKYINNLKILYFIKNGIHVSDIKPAPDKFNLLKYGGNWTNDMFLEELKKLNISKELKMPNLEYAIFEREKIISIVKNIINVNKQTIRVVEEDIEDDCIICNGNRISLGIHNIWALSNKEAPTSVIISDKNALKPELSTSKPALSKTKLALSTLKSKIDDESDSDNFDFNKFLLEEVFK